ncbi:hypothetical protein BASA61_009118 [Batrachochytrium salamandrivorans]|nr:hypothetical protein BASA61_009118 [Batrachochytrium salamandrivorans]
MNVACGQLPKAAARRFFTAVQMLLQLLSRSRRIPSTVIAFAPLEFQIVDGKGISELFKKGGDLRLCMDYRALNQITIKDQYPLPLISDLLGTLGGNRYFTTLDLRGAYELLRIKAGDEHKTAFLTKFGQFEFRVMPYGLSNAPPQFQAFMNDLFRSKGGKCVLVYLDDIVVYGNELAQHKKDVNFVLQILRNNKLYCKPEKCHFYKQSISYLGYIISSSGLEMDPSKISSITEWPTPKSVKDIQTLLGFTNFYRGFIPHYSKLTLPLTTLLKKDNKFQWTVITEQALTDLKGEFLKQTILAHPDEDKPFLLETDASDFAISGILSQKDGATGIRPVAFYSRQMVPAERNYEIYDKELLAIVECFRHWRHFLQGGKHKILVISDHKNLEYFMTTKRLTRRHARWALTLSEFDFEISYRPGSRNAKADHLSRRPDYHIKEEPSTLIRLLQPNNFTSIMATEINVPTGNSFYSPIRKENIDLDSDWPLIVEDFLHADTWPTELPEQILKRCERETNLFTYDDLGRFCRLTENGKSTAEYCPKDERTKILKRFHDGAAHLKYDSIKDNLKRYYWWPTMAKDMTEYIRKCPQCQLTVSNTGTHSQSQIRVIPPAVLTFERFGIDAVDPLPRTKREICIY